MQANSLDRFDVLKDQTRTIAGVKQSLFAVVPSDFSWALTIQEKWEVTLRLKYNGRPGVQRTFTRTDSDFSILVHLLKQVNWEEERKLAVASIDPKQEVAVLARREIALAAVEQSKRDIEARRTTLFERREARVSMSSRRAAIEPARESRAKQGEESGKRRRGRPADPHLAGII